jgi:hypothetical protein
MNPSQTKAKAKLQESTTRQTHDPPPTNTNRRHRPFDTQNQAELSKKSTEPACFNNVLTLKEITD